MTNKEYLGHMLRRATQLFGQNALSVQDITRQLQEIKQKESSAEGMPRFSQFHAGFRMGPEPKQSK